MDVVLLLLDLHARKHPSILRAPIGESRPMGMILEHVFSAEKLDLHKDAKISHKLRKTGGSCHKSCDRWRISKLVELDPSLWLEVR